MIRPALCIALAVYLTACATLTPAERIRIRALAIDAAGVAVQIAAAAAIGSMVR